MSGVFFYLNWMCALQVVARAVIPERLTGKGINLFEFHFQIPPAFGRWVSVWPGGVQVYAIKFTRTDKFILK